MERFIEGGDDMGKVLKCRDVCVDCDFEVQAKIKAAIKDESSA